MIGFRINYKFVFLAAIIPILNCSFFEWPEEKRANHMHWYGKITSNDKEPASVEIINDIGGIRQTTTDSNGNYYRADNTGGKAGETPFYSLNIKKKGYEYITTGQECTLRVIGDTAICEFDPIELTQLENPCVVAFKGKVISSKIDSLDSLGNKIQVHIGKGPWYINGNYNPVIVRFINVEDSLIYSCDTLYKICGPGEREFSIWIGPRYDYTETGPYLDSIFRISPVISNDTQVYDLGIINLD